jgi:hypothetical protein
MIRINGKKLATQQLLVHAGAVNLSIEHIVYMLQKNKEKEI